MLSVCLIYNRICFKIDCMISFYFEIHCDQNLVVRIIFFIVIFRNFTWFATWIKTRIVPPTTTKVLSCRYLSPHKPSCYIFFRSKYLTRMIYNFHKAIFLYYYKYIWGAKTVNTHLLLLFIPSCITFFQWRLCSGARFRFRRDMYLSTYSDMG